MKLPQVQLGRTGISTSRLGLGGLGLTSERAADVRASLMVGLKAGINYVDTAPAYGSSEEVLGLVLRDADPEQQLVVSTKLGGRPSPFDPRDEDALLFSVQESLRLLGRDRIDILLVHEPDRKREYDWWFDDLSYEGPVRRLLDRLKAEGLIAATGIGGTTAHELARICESGAFDVVLTAFNFSLLWREAELEIFPAAKRHGMGVIAGSPLQGGMLATRRDEQVAAAPWVSRARKEQFAQLYRMLDDYKLGIAEVALRFVYYSHHIDCTLTGIGSPQELEANLKAVEDGPLPHNIVDRLDEIYSMVPFRPSLEPFTLPLDKTTAGQAKFH